MSKIPEWAIEMALNVASAFHLKTTGGYLKHSTPELADHIALALVEAERRGIEKAAGFHDKQADQFEKAAFQELSVSRKLRNDAAAEQHRAVAAAIRQLGETP